VLSLSRWFTARFYCGSDAHYRSRFCGKHPKVGWVRSDDGTLWMSKAGALKVIYSTSMYDYGTLGYVEEMLL